MLMYALRNINIASFYKVNIDNKHLGAATSIYN